MDLIIGIAKGPDGFSTCMFAGNYNQSIESKRIFTSMAGQRIQVLSVFLGKGPQVQEIHASLQERVKCNMVGWYDASPGQITDTVHHILAPESLANTFTRSVDQFIAPVESKSNVSADSTEPGERPQSGKPPRNGKQQPDAGTKRVRVRKPKGT